MRSETRRHSKIKHFVHLIWATKNREPLLTEELERQVHRCIVSEAEKCKCVVRAIGGMPDHVHLVLWLSTTVSIATLMKQVKGVSSAMANNLLGQRHRFRWQEGFGLYSVSPSLLNKGIEYVVNQKQHHAEGTLHPEWEETDEEE